MADQWRDVFRPLAQRRNVDRQHVQPEPQVFAKLSLPHRLLQILVRRGDDAHVHFERTLPADPLDDPALQHAQQLRLRLRAQVTDFVEKQRTAVRQLEAALAPVRGAREGAALVTEHFRLDQIARQGGAVLGDERLAAARAEPVDRRRDELLAGARFARDQHPRFRGRDPRNQRAQLFHRGARSDQRIGVSQLLVQPLVLGQGASQFQRAAQRHQHPFGRERLFDELEGAELRGAHGVGQRGLAAHHHDGDVRRAFADLLQRREAVRSRWHHQVEQYDVGRVIDEPHQGRIAALRFDGFEAIRLEQRPDHPPDVGFVVDQQDARAHEKVGEGW